MKTGILMLIYEPQAGLLLTKCRFVSNKTVCRSPVSIKVDGSKSAKTENFETPGQAAVTVTVKETGEKAIANALFEYEP